MNSSSTIDDLPRSLHCILPERFFSTILIWLKWTRIPTYYPTRRYGNKLQWQFYVVIFLLLQKLTMIRVPEATSCFLSDSIGNVPRPADLLQLLKLVCVNSNPSSVYWPRNGLVSDLSCHHAWQIQHRLYKSLITLSNLMFFFFPKNLDLDYI